jgi:hypothetical protein
LLVGGRTVVEDGTLRTASQQALGAAGAAAHRAIMEAS